MARIVLNIGLSTEQIRGEGAPDLTIDDIHTAVTANTALAVWKIEVVQSDTEPTAVVVCEGHLRGGDIFHLALDLHQQAIAYYHVPARYGKLVGPEAAGWGKFNPEKFYLPSGTTLAAYNERSDA